MSISSTHRRQSGFNPLLAFLLIVFGVVGVVATLHFTGKVKIDAIDRLLGRKQVQAADTNRVAVTVAVRPLEPGHRVVTADLWNPEKSFYQVVFVQKDKVHPDWILSPTDIEARVIGRPKGAGRAFTEADFLPPGSSDGPVALVPEGMTLVTLDGSKIRGLDKLSYGDMFTLLVSEPVDRELFDEAEKVLAQRGGNDIARKLELASLKDMAHQRVLVQKGKLIQAAKPGASKQEKDVAVALKPEDVPPLLAALDLEHNVYCAAHSGLAGAEETNPMRIPDQEPPVERLAWLWESVHEVELINGTERTSVTVPKD